MKFSASLVDRFWISAHAIPEHPCWEWSAARTKGGYGLIGEGKHGLHYAHRLSYQLHHGAIPEGLFIRHRCDNPGCVNPDHLLAGTHADNMRDASQRKRWPLSRLERCQRGHDAWGAQDGGRYRKCLECARVANNASRNRRRLEGR